MHTNLTKPLLILDKSRCMANINRMLAKVDKSTSKLRPHFKTHNHAVVGSWFAEAGVKQITVSNPFMAEYFVAHKWKDITIAFPFNISWLPLVSQLAVNASINILVDNEDILQQLTHKAMANLGVFIKVDTGYHRTGVNYRDVNVVDSMVAQFYRSKHLSYKGFLTHAGHTYTAGSQGKIKTIYDQAFSAMNDLKKRYADTYPDISISYGDTPSCSILPALDKFDEYRPGNFVFNDVMQKYIGSCTDKDIALVLACPVVSVNRQRNEIVVHGGAIHLSKDFIVKNNTPLYGEMVLFTKDSWYKPDGEAYVKSLSQEHGIIKADSDLCQKIKPGDVVGVLPVHSCLTTFQMGYDYKIINKTTP